MSRVRTCFSLNTDGCFESTSSFLFDERTSLEKERKHQQAMDVTTNSSRNVLIVDDCSLNRRMLDVMLRKLGHKTSLAINGLEALEKAQSEEFDLILMDLQMPEMDGLVATKKIMEYVGHSRGLSIVAISALVDPRVTQKCFECGMKAFYAKPIVLSDLREIVQLY